MRDDWSWMLGMEALVFENTSKRKGARASCPMPLTFQVASRFYNIPLQKLNAFIMQTSKNLFFAKIAMRDACTESPRKWRNTAGAYLVQAPEP
jgi:hypothetical protein